MSFPSRLLEAGGKALLISLVLIFVARPAAVLLSVLPFKFTGRELVFVSWVGLKGAVPMTLATFPLMLATPEVSLQAKLLFDVVSFIVVVSAVAEKPHSAFASPPRRKRAVQPRRPGCSTWLARSHG